MLADRSVTLLHSGARRHYAVAEILERNQLLQTFFTDIWIERHEAWFLKAILTLVDSSALRRALGRRNGSVPDARVVDFRVRALQHLLGNRSASLLEQLQHHIKRSDLLAASIEKLAPDIPALYVTHRESGGLLNYVAQNGGKIFLEQAVAPLRYELERLRAFGEVAQAQGETGTAYQFSDLEWYFEREKKEWDSATHIICVSEYVRNALLAEGVAASKLHTVASGVHLPNASPKKSSSRKLNVLFVGQLSRRKGIQYVVEVATRLRGQMNFRAVGPCADAEIMRSATYAGIQMIGAVPRDTVAQHYEWADILLFPSLNEGAALVTYEALARGLPVICSPSAGSVVRHGINGLILEPDCLDEIADALNGIANSSAKRQSLFDAAYEYRFDVSFERYEVDLVRALQC